MRTIYAKASVERRREYRQLTLIQEEGGKRFVRKTPENPDAAEHMKSYRRNYEALTAALAPGSRIRLLPCETQEDGSVLFPFLEAETLTDRLNAAGEADYVREAVRFRDALAEAFGTFPFAAGEDFRAFFPGISLPEGLEALGVTNLDMNFDNVFLTGDGEYTLIDYEWMLPFRVPAVYVLYRSLLSDPAYARFGEEARGRIREALGIGETLEESLWAMEMAFQRHAAADEDKLDLYIPGGGNALAESVSFDALAQERTQRQKLEKDLAEYRTAYDRQQEAIRKLSDERDEYKAAYDRAQEEYAAAHERQQEAIRKLSDERDEYKAAYDRAQEEYAAAHERQQEAIRKLTEERDESRRAFEEYSGAYRTQSGMLADKQRELEEKQRELDGTAAAFARYREEITGLWWYKVFYRNRKDENA